MAKGIQPLSEEILSGVKAGLPKPPPQNPTLPNASAEEAQPPIEGSFHGALEEAANLLISILQPSLKDYTLEIADLVLKIPRWQLLLGSLVAQHEGGTLSAPTIDPAWRQIEVLQQNSVCQYPACKKPFSPKKFGQKYCSPECGNKARKDEIAAINKKRDLLREAEHSTFEEFHTPKVA